MIKSQPSSLHLLLCAACFGTALGSSQRADAQAQSQPAPQAVAPDEPQAEPDAYRPLIDAAITEYDARNFLEARALFVRAHGLYPNARTFRGLGMVAFELREYEASIEMLEHALKATAKPLEGTLRKRTEELLDRARSFVAHVEIVLTPGTARVRIDGESVELGSGGGIRLGVGEHVIEIDAHGYETLQRKIEVMGGDDRTLTITLSRKAPRVASAREAAAMSEQGDARSPLGDEQGAPRDDDSGGVLESPWFWGGVVIVAAAVVVTGVIVLGAEDKEESSLPPRSGVTVSALRVAL